MADYGNPGSYSYSAEITLGIWAYRAAGWQKVTTDSTYVAEYGYGDDYMRSFSWYLDGSYALGNSDITWVGVGVDSTSGVSASVSTITSLSYQVNASGGVRSATPSGEITTVTVAP